MWHPVRRSLVLSLLSHKLPSFVLLTMKVFTARILASSMLLAFPAGPVFFPSTTVVAVDNNDKFVTCGSAVKLTHVESGGKYYLHSENKNLGGGSGQQIVTLIPEKSTTTTLWWIREAQDDEYCVTASSSIKCGSKIRLTHLDTMRNLHTHAHTSPLSRQQEMTAFGNDGNGDAMDDWIVECSTGHWKRDTHIRLFHVGTQKYLGGSSQVQFNQQNCGGGCPIMNHLEAFGRQRADAFSEFKAELGVYLFK